MAMHRARFLLGVVEGVKGWWFFFAMGLRGLLNEGDLCCVHNELSYT